MRLRPICFTLFFFWSIFLAVFAQEPVFLEHGGGVRTVEFSPVNASLLASAGESHLIKLWDLKNDTVRTLSGHTDIVKAVAFSPNGELLVSVSDDRTIRFWNVQSQQNTGTRNITDRYQSIAFSPNGQIFATGGGGHVKLWNPRLQREIVRLPHNKDVRTVAFSPDGHLLAAGEGSGEGPGTVKVWDVKGRQVVVSLNANPKNVKAVEFSRDHQYLASSGWNGYLKVWETSNWDLQHTIPHVGHYDIAFSPDGKMLASTGNGYVGLWWVEDGARIAQLKGPTGWMHPVDFSHDGTSLAVGAEDGIVRIWRIDTSPVDGREAGAIQILHVDTYLQQLLDANSIKGDNIPDPAPPPAVVRAFFQLDPFYEQWINVGGLPVIASAKVNPYALKEAAWLILKMIGHRRDVLRAMVGNKTRFSIIAHTEIITEIPEYRDDAPPDFLISRERGWGGSRQATVSSSEEDILNYRGSRTRGRYSVLIHEAAHGIHKFGFNTVDPSFDERLRDTYQAAMKKGLWQGTYASSDRKEYWAEGTQAWFHPNGGGSFDRFGDTRQTLKVYDPGLARLLTEVYGDGQWRYTLPETRNHFRHLQGFNPRETPTFNGWPELETLYRELSNPNSIGGGQWVNLKPYAPNQLSRLTRSNVHDRTTMIFVNATDADVLIYGISSNATESFWTRIYPNRVRWTGSRVNRIWLVKDISGRNIAAFQAVEKTGRARIGAAEKNVNAGGAAPQALIPQFQRPPMYWIDADHGTLHRLVGNEVENLLPNVENATRLAVDTPRGRLYWTTKTNERRGKIYRVNLKGTPNIEELRDLYGVPLDLAVDPQRKRLYWIDALNRIQRSDLNAENIRNLVRDLKAPKHLTLDVTGGHIYWTEQTDTTTGKIRRAALDGSNVQLVKALTSAPHGLALDPTNRKIYLTTADGKIQRLNVDGSNVESDLITGLDAPKAVSVDVAGRKIYWTAQNSIRRADLNGENIEDVVTGVGAPTGLVIGSMPPVAPAAPATVGIPPETTVLLVNYPNPFNPETWIPYQLSAPAAVTVNIYDMKGALIRTLTIGHQAAGYYTDRNRAVYWDGRNGVGEPVASGVYFYTLTAGDFTATRKLLIRK